MSDPKDKTLPQTPVADTASATPVIAETAPKKAAKPAPKPAGSSKSSKDEKKAEDSKSSGMSEEVMSYLKALMEENTAKQGSIWKLFMKLKGAFSPSEAEDKPAPPMSAPMGTQTQMETQKQVMKAQEIISPVTKPLSGTEAEPIAPSIPKNPGK